MERLDREGDDDFSFGLANMGRFRCSAFKQRGTLAAVLRVVPFHLPDPKALPHPRGGAEPCRQKKRGMALVTGPAGSGKTTTLACIIDRINQSRSGHIITLEDPIEYIHPHKNCLVTQREVENDTLNFRPRAARVAAAGAGRDPPGRDARFRNHPDRADRRRDGPPAALHPAHAGREQDHRPHCGRVPASQQQQVRIQLSMVLQAVVSQQLIPAIDGGIVPAFEVMLVNSAIANMIRENKVQQMDNVIYAGSSEGMISMDNDILRLYKEKRITRENALLYAMNPDVLLRRM